MYHVSISPEDIFQVDDSQMLVSYDFDLAKCILILEIFFVGKETSHGKGLNVYFDNLKSS